MKKILFLTMLLFVNCLVIAQENNSISSSLLTINEKKYIGESESYLIKSLGKPNSKENYFFEMDDQHAVKYKYNGIVFYVIEGIINSFEITSNSFEFINPDIKIGSSVNMLKKHYPLSFNNRSTRQEGIILTLTDIDKFVVFEWNYWRISKIYVLDY